MKESVFNDNVFEAVFRQSVIDNFEREIAEIEREPDVPVSERQRKRMSALFAKARRTKRIEIVFINLRRFAMATAAVFIVISCALLTVPAVRASVGDALFGWYAHFAQFGQSNSEAAIATEWYVTYLPNGYTETSKTQAGEITIIRYENADSNMIEFKYATSDNTIAANNEIVEYGQVSLNGVVYHKFATASNEYTSAVIWVDDGYIFKVTSYLPIDELVEIAYSVECSGAQ